MPDLRALLAVLAVGCVLIVLAVVRSAYDDGPAPQDRRCQQLRAVANAVPSREDTVDDELEYLRKARAAERACSETN